LLRSGTSKPYSIHAWTSSKVARSITPNCCKLSKRPRSPYSGRSRPPPSPAAHAGRARLSGCVRAPRGLAYCSGSLPGGPPPPRGPGRCPPGPGCESAGSGRSRGRRRSPRGVSGGRYRKRETFSAVGSAEAAVPGEGESNRSAHTMRPSIAATTTHAPAGQGSRRCASSSDSRSSSYSACMREVGGRSSRPRILSSNPSQTANWSERCRPVALRLACTWWAFCRRS